jgi:mRNA interferase RelE/StbE
MADSCPAAEALRVCKNVHKRRIIPSRGVNSPSFGSSRRSSRRHAVSAGDVGWQRRLVTATETTSRVAISAGEIISNRYIACVKTITWTLAARRELRKLPPDVRADIEAKIERFASTGAGNVKRLTGRPGTRLRAGDWRVIFVETATTVEVRAVGNRRDVYK